jgi:hypothetical protein
MLGRLILTPLLVGGFDARAVLGIGGKWVGEWLVRRVVGGGPGSLGVGSLTAGSTDGAPATYPRVYT